MTLEENLLENRNAQELKALLKRVGDDHGPTRKADLVKALCDLWRVRPKALLDLLIPAERDLLAECVHGDTNYPDVEAVNAKYGHEYKLPAQPGWQKCHPIRFFVASDFDYAPILVEGVADTLRALLPRPPPVETKTMLSAPDQGAWGYKRYDGEKVEDRRPLKTTDSELAGPTEARRVLQLAAAGKIKVGESTGAPSAPSVALLAQILAAPEFDVRVLEGEHKPWKEDDADPGPVRASVWPVLMQQCGWAKTQGSTLVLTKAGKEYLANPSVAAYVEGVNRWDGDEKFDELRRATVIRGQIGGRGRRGLTHPADRRAIIEDGLETLSLGQWVMVEEFYRAMRARGDDCEVCEEDGALFIGERQYGTLYGYGPALALTYLKIVLFEALAVMGLVNVAYAPPHWIRPGFRDAWGIDDLPFISRADGVFAFALTGLGAHWLGLNESYTPPQPPSRALYRVLPNHDIVVLGAEAFTAADKAMLERIAIQTSDAVWKLDRTRLLDTMSGGATAKELRDEVARSSENELPQPVEVFFEELGRKQDRIAGVEDAVLVTFTDAASAGLALSEPAIRKLALPAGDCGVVVRRKNLSAFRSALKKMGILLP